MGKQSKGKAPARRHEHPHDAATGVRNLKEKDAALATCALSKQQQREAAGVVEKAAYALDEVTRTLALFEPFKHSDAAWYAMKHYEHQVVQRVHQEAIKANTAAEVQVLATESAWNLRFGTRSQTPSATKERVGQELTAAQNAVTNFKRCVSGYEKAANELKLVQRQLATLQGPTIADVAAATAAREAGNGAAPEPRNPEEEAYQRRCAEWTRALLETPRPLLEQAVRAFSERLRVAPDAVYNMIAVCANKAKPGGLDREADGVLCQLRAAVDSFEVLLRPGGPWPRRAKLTAAFVCFAVGFAAHNEVRDPKNGGLTTAIVREAQERMAREHSGEVWSPTSKEGLGALSRLRDRVLEAQASTVKKGAATLERLGPQLQAAAAAPAAPAPEPTPIGTADAKAKALQAMRSFATAYEREATPTGRNGKKNLTSEYDRRVAKMLAAINLDDTNVGFSCPKVAMLYYISGFEDCCPGAPRVSVAAAHQRVLLCKELRATQERVPSLRVCAWCKEPRYCPSIAKWVWGPLITPTFRCAGCVPPDGQLSDDQAAEFGRYCSEKCQKAAWSYRKPRLFDEVLAARTAKSEAGSSAAHAACAPCAPPAPSAPEDAPSPPVNRHRTQRHRDVCPRHDLQSAPQSAPEEFDGLSESEVHRGVTMGYFEANIAMALTLNAANVPEDCTAGTISVPKLPVMELCEAAITQILAWKMPPQDLYSAAGELCGCIQKNALDIVASSPVPKFARVRGAKRIARKIVACFYVRCAHPLQRKVHLGEKLVRAWKRTLQHRATAFPHDWHIRKALQRKLWEPTFPCDFDARFLFKSSTFFVYDDGHKPAVEREQEDCELLLDHHADGSLADSSGPFAMRFKPSPVQLCSGVPASEQSTRYDYMESFPETLIMRLPTSRFVENEETDSCDIVHGRPWVHCPTTIRWSELPFRAAFSGRAATHGSTEHELVAMQVGRMRRKTAAQQEDYCIWWAYVRERDGQWYELYGSEGTRGVWDAPRFGRRVTAPMAGRKVAGCFPINLFYQRKRAGASA